MQTLPTSYDTAAWLIIESLPNHVVATWKSIVAIVWRGETTLEAVATLRAACGELANAQPQGIGVLTIVGPNAPLPAHAARKAIAKVLAEGSALIKCSALVIEGSGFRASAVRSVVTGLTLLAKQPFPHQVCTVEEAAGLFSQYLQGPSGRALTQSALRSGIDELRQLVQY